MAKASRAEWAKRVERWRDSGLTAKEFAAELDISPNGLTYWKWKLRADAQRATVAERQRKEPAAASTTFVELVPAAEPSAPDGSLELMFPSGVVLRVPRNFDESTLTRLVGLLGGA